MKSPGGAYRLGGWQATLFAFTLLTAACTPDYLRTMPTEPYSSDHRQTYPVTAERRVNTMSLAGAFGDSWLSAGELAQLDKFFETYLSNGRGQLLINIPRRDSAQVATLNRGKQIVERARQTGLRESEILLRLDTAATGGNGNITLSYDSFVARVPECGDWSKGSSYDITNTPVSGFGCSVQRNIGIMIADPGDLVAPRAAELRDTARSDAVIQLYRSGEATLSERTAAESAAVTEIGD